MPKNHCSTLPLAEHLSRILPQTPATAKLPNSLFFPGSINNNITLELQEKRRVQSPSWGDDGSQRLKVLLWR